MGDVRDVYRGPLPLSFLCICCWCRFARSCAGRALGNGCVLDVLHEQVRT